MEIRLLSQVIEALSPVTIEISDTGNSYVRAAFSINQRRSLTLNEPGTGSASKRYDDLEPGDHNGSLTVAATNQPMGPYYNTKLIINGQTVAAAEGALNEFTEADFVNFIIRVI